MCDTVLSTRIIETIWIKIFIAKCRECYHVTITRYDYNDVVILVKASADTSVGSLSDVAVCLASRLGIKLELLSIWHPPRPNAASESRTDLSKGSTIPKQKQAKVTIHDRKTYTCGRHESRYDIFASFLDTRSDDPRRFFRTCHFDAKCQDVI